MVTPYVEYVMNYLEVTQLITEGIGYGILFTFSAFMLGFVINRLILIMLGRN